MSPRLTVIAAVAANGVIGRDNALPWHIPEDLKRFRALTLGHPVVMGRKTFESIVARLGKPLPGRRNLVISNSLSAAPPGAEIYRSMDEALEACAANEEVFVIGGEAIFALALPRAQRLELTEVDAAIEGDTWFPAFDRGQFEESARESGSSGELGYAFVSYRRKEPR